MCGIRYPPDANTIINGGRYYEWVRNGFALYDALAANTVAIGWEVIEVFPPHPGLGCMGQRVLTRAQLGRAMRWFRSVSPDSQPGVLTRTTVTRSRQRGQRGSVPRPTCSNGSATSLCRRSLHPDLLIDLPDPLAATLTIERVVAGVSIATPSVRVRAEHGQPFVIAAAATRAAAPSRPCPSGPRVARPRGDARRPVPWRPTPTIGGIRLVLVWETAPQTRRRMQMADDDRQAWIVRMTTGGGDTVDTGVRDNLLLLGWSAAEGLLACDDYWAFRDIVHEAHYKGDTNYRRSGHAAKQLWKFLKVMKPGDLVVAPHGRSFYVGEIDDGPPIYDASGGQDTPHRRPVRWLSRAAAIPRTTARAELISRMKSYHTVTTATDLIDEIKEAVAAASSPEAPTSLGSLRQRLIDTTKQELQRGHMDEHRFERLVRDVLLALGAVYAEIVPRQEDIGADIEAEFSIGHLTTVPVRVQVKWWHGTAGTAPISQLLAAKDDVRLGVVATTAEFSDEARSFAPTREDEDGKQILLVDGDELSRLIVEHSLSSLLAARNGLVRGGCIGVYRTPVGAARRVMPPRSWRTSIGAMASARPSTAATPAARASRRGPSPDRRRTSARARPPLAPPASPI